jgi:histidine ammonia-lyase
MVERTVTVGLSGLSPEEVVAVSRQGAPVNLSEPARRAMRAARHHVERLAAGETPVYGISTGFGALSTRHIDRHDRARLQLSLIRSHAAGAGAPVEDDLVRATMLLRLRTLASGITGVRPLVAESFIAMLNAGITPLVPEFGSLGCSGDLAPLAHCALVAMGEGEARGRDGSVAPARELLGRVDLEPLVLEEKEGLGLINGTEGMLAMLILYGSDLRQLLKLVDITAAMSTEALLGTDRAFSSHLIALRPQPGQAESADNLCRLLTGSKLVASHRNNDDRVQDAYSIRCAPQVAGAARDTLSHAEAVARRELEARIDNPVVLEDGAVESNGNFHGAPLGYVLDFLAIAVADVGSMSERRTDRMLDVARSGGLPAFLALDPGVDSGLMIAHYTQAALVAENKRLAVPASTDSIPTSAMQEDHVSMGWAAGRKLRRAVVNLRRVLAVELLAASRALELRAPLEPAPATGAVMEEVRSRTGGVGHDRVISELISKVEGLISEGAVIAAAESEIGPLR